MQNDPFSLRGKTAIVAGASRGIGLAIAHGFAAFGASVFGCGRSSHANDSIDSFHYRQVDLQNEEAVSSFCAEAAGPSGNLDVVVYSAAVSEPVISGMQSMEAFSNAISVNLVSAFRFVRCSNPWITSGTSIIFITSINSSLGFPANPGYVSSKGGLRQLTRALAVDLGPRGIRVNAIAPGYIHTEMTASSYRDVERRQAREARTILGRWGSTSDLVGAAVFLGSAASSYVTGHELVVDGGWTAKGL